MESELEEMAKEYGDVSSKRKKQKRQRQKRLVIELLYDYAKNSTLHGLRYIVDNGLHIVERFFWFLTVIGSIVICSFYIYNVVQKWRTSPVLVTVNGRLSSVGSVPFPSVTICPQFKVNPLYYNYSSVREMLTGNESLWHGGNFAKFLHIDLLCDDSFYKNNRYEVTLHRRTTSKMVKDITEAALTSDDIFHVCSWHNDKYSNCDSVFSKVITQEGVCFTANSLSTDTIFRDTVQQEFPYIESNVQASAWSLEDGYIYSSDEPSYPKRGRVFGSDPDLSVILENSPIRGDRGCSNMYSGYKIYLHHPADFPQSSMYYYAVLPGEIASVAISFHEFSTESSLVAYDSNIRQCYFPTDRQLRYFKIYTATNCLAECLSNYTLKTCGCVGFYMPHHNSSQICHPTKSDTCIKVAQDRMALQERQGDLGLTEEGCRCLPACNTIDYDAEILKTEFRKQDMLKDYKLANGDRNNITYSKIDLFYKKPQFVTMQRRELFGVTDLLANIGGLLGVFLGFSFLSLIEIFYFLTVRLGFVLKRDLNQEKTNRKTENKEVELSRLSGKKETY